MTFAFAVGLISPGTHAADSLTCTGRFPNPITDICWSCILPISIGSATIANFDGQEDIANPSSPVCSCGVNPSVGLSIGFWEPARHVEAVRKPFCLASLGGIDLDPGIPAPAGARFTHSQGDGDGGSFYQAHFYVNPVLYWLQVVADFPCLERGSFDLAYLTEVDPLWNDDELTLILNPEAVLFANPVAVAACAADCVAATAGFGIAELFWCAGCQGGIYPLDGHVPYHMGGVRTAALLAQRLTAKMHRELLAWGWHGRRACAARTSCRRWTRPPTRRSSPTPWPTPPRTAAAAASPSAAARSSGGPARNIRCAARTSPSCCSARGTAVWAIEDCFEGFRSRDRAVRTTLCAAGWVLLAGVATGQTLPQVTDADIERARRQHAMPSEAELARVPVPATPRIDALPEPETRSPVDLEAIARGFDKQALRPALGTGRGPSLLIFVSFAMPEATLNRLMDQASRAGATLVLRGLVNGSLRDTVERMQRLIGQRQVSVQIDPQAFDRFSIVRTPSFVLVRDGATVAAVRRRHVSGHRPVRAGGRRCQCRVRTGVLRAQCAAHGSRRVGRAATNEGIAAMIVRRAFTGFTLVCFIATQTASLAGPHDEGVAAGQAANPVARGNVTAPGASSVVPGYTSSPAQRSYYRQPNLAAQANAQPRVVRHLAR